MGMRSRLSGFLAAVLLLGGLVVVVEGGGKGRRDEAPGQQKEEKTAKPSGEAREAEKESDWVPPGLSDEEKAEWEDGRPPGWSRGRKEGWKGGDMPPGLAKKDRGLPPGLAKKPPPGWSEWSSRKKKQWEEELEKAKDEVRSKAKGLEDFSEEDLDEAVLSVEASAREGVPLARTLDVVKRTMAKGIGGGGIETATRAVAYGVGKGTDFDELGQFVEKQLEDGLRDDELSIAIYKEIARCQEERAKAKKAIEQKKEEQKDQERQQEKGTKRD